MARGPLSSPHHVGLDGCLRVLEELLAEATAAAGLPAEQPVAAVGHVLLAGADLPVEERALHDAISARGWAVRTTVSNDTFAILRAGTERGWGVAVVCGAGINCVGVAPDGRHVRFPALGTITGDWGGGHDVGLAAVSARGAQRGRARAEDHAPGARARRTSGSPRRRRSPRRSTSAGSRRGACSSSRRWSLPRRRSTRWRPRSSIASPPRSSPSRAWR